MAKPQQNNNNQLVYLDGKLVPRAEAKVSVYDHGLLYGDGVFEGIRIYNSRVFKLDEHLKRLYRSARAIMLEIPMQYNELKDAVLMTVRANQRRDGYIRLVVTRGEGDLGLSPWMCPKPFIFIIVDKIGLYPEEFYKNGLEIITAPTRKHIPEGLNPNIKSLNYLNNILAKIEARHAGVMEAVMLNSEGFVAEGTGDNIFIVQNKTLITPPAYMGSLDGITKATVFELAKKLRLAAKESVLTRFDLFNADECFLTGTAAEVVPVVKIDQRVIGDGKPGPITLRLIKSFRALTQREGVPVYTKKKDYTD
ncbi:MAG: branched-chain-amino-acid transaminase [bacterium]|nr:branched-chain-amino-acid transaminase [bacterium]